VGRGAVVVLVGGGCSGGGGGVWVGDGALVIVQGNNTEQECR